MEGRSGVRSSARLSAEAARGAPAAAASAGSAAARQAARLAAERRARAAERAREVEDSPRVFRDKCRVLARALRNAKHLVVYTGAGISTAADIPDYRGPHGVWTRLQRGESIGQVDVSRATPTFTHMALSALYARGTLKFVVSQNCDGLHLRSGLPRRALAELHGDMYVETCPACRTVYLRAFDTTERTARHAHGTRRLCHKCSHELRDSIVHFGERGRAAWPLNWAGALRHAAAADVILCLGSSLKVLRRYPRLWSMQRPPSSRPPLYIVNLQWTPKDSVAALKINARCDAVMAEVARRLHLRVPPYRPAADPLHAHATPLHARELHTTRRLPLAPSDSEDDDLPLHTLAARLERRADAPPPPKRLRPPSPVTPLNSLRPPETPNGAPSPSDPASPKAEAERSSPPSPPLRSFRIAMAGVEPTILLRPEHAPPPPEPPPRPGGLSDLRRFRFAKRPPLSNGHGPPTLGRARSPASAPPESKVKVKKEEPDENGVGAESKLRRLLEYSPRIDKDEFSTQLGFDGSSEYALAKREVKEEAEGGGGEAWAGALAAAIIARAVLACRGSLYPGLHTILAPAAQCEWCWRVRGARRCLWWPAVRGGRRGGAAAHRRRCACCPDGSAPDPDPAPDDAGWYGKGYRKGRRRRR